MSDAKFKRGDAVQQVLPAPFKGIITQMSIDSDSGEISYLIDPDGDPNTPGERWFTGAQLELQAAPSAEGAEGAQA